MGECAYHFIRPELPQSSPKGKGECAYHIILPELPQSIPKGKMVKVNG